MTPRNNLSTGHTNEDTLVLVAEYWDFKASSEDDYTAFDQFQGMEFLEFDARLMSAFSIPEHIIDDYLDFMTPYAHS
jgi:hypothetical protein